MSDATCMFCSGNGKCINGQCNCLGKYILTNESKDCSVVGCLDNCTNNATAAVGNCTTYYP